ncbi:ATP-binding protein [Candidatus Uhrbacteria bacterium]|nr:ATP-binding protein [Candidatus Uhrbacteria bacterium]
MLIGPRQAGKTVILKQVQQHLTQRGEHTFFLNLEDPDYLRLLNETPKNLFAIIPIAGLTTRVIVFLDEVQYLDNPSHFLKFFYDEYRESIKIIVSGSSAFYIDEKFTDSLAGRKKIFYVHTLSFREFLVFKGAGHLCDRLDAHTLSEREQIRNQYSEYMMFGGYPRVVLAQTHAEKKDLLQEIAYSYVKKDVFDAGIRKDDSFYRLLRILASQVGNLVNTNELARTIGVSTSAIRHYLYIAQKSFHIVLTRPFFRNLRKELTKMPKAYFSDLGLRNFFVQNFESITLRNDRGFLLENAALREMSERISTDEIKFWRTTQDREVDFVIEGIGAFEVKYALSAIRIKQYEEFRAVYPNISFSFIAFDAQKQNIHDVPVHSVWSIPLGS